MPLGKSSLWREAGVQASPRSRVSDLAGSLVRETSPVVAAPAPRSPASQTQLAQGRAALAKLTLLLQDPKRDPKENLSSFAKVLSTALKQEGSAQMQS